MDTNAVSSAIFFLVAILAFAENVELKSTSNAGKKRPMEGLHFTVAFIHVPPFDVITQNPDGNSSFSGSSKMAYLWLAEKLGFTIHLYLVDESVNEKYGSVTEFTNWLLTSNKIDAIGTGIIATPERTKFLDFSYVKQIEPYAMIVPVPEPELRLFAFVRPFQPTVWLLIAISVFVVAVLVCLFTHIYKVMLRRNREILPRQNGRQIQNVKVYDRHFGNYLMSVISNMTNQGGMDPINRCSVRIFIGFWLLMVTIVINSYSGTVISYLTVETTKPPIKTLEDLAASKDVTIILRDDSIIAQHILKAEMGVLKVLGDQARRKPGNIFPDMLNITRRLNTGHYAHPFLAGFCKYYIANQFKKEGNCRFTMSEHLPIMGFWSLPLQKGSKYKEVFKDAIIELWQTGLTSAWYNDVIPKAPKCFAKQQSKTTSQRQLPIGLDDLMGGFFIYGIGMSLATIVFILENIYARYYKNRDPLLQVQKHSA